MNKLEAERRLKEIGPGALRLARGTRETIALCNRIGAKENAVLIPKLRRDTLAAIRQAKREYRMLKAALASGVYDGT
ncbi:hypothetical protein ACFSR9_09195 [Deinococcus taklimakanensis]|uniref:Uncharacterized protein n=1 Tax=Deinococcus taklimakanensis TaxID=536443 RepID=A0ABW5P3L9_9DEIO